MNNTSPDSRDTNSVLSLAELIEILDEDSANIGPENMDDILRRVVVAAAEIQQHARFSDLRYARNLVHKTDRFEVMVMCWHSGQRSSIHDHAGSLGGLKVLQGELTESLFDKAPNGMIKSLTSADYGAGAIRVEETALIHQISNLRGDNGKSISLHVYVPPLTRMNVYSLEDPSVKNILPRYFNSGSGI
jgi:cysteine dioxygenase